MTEFARYVPPHEVAARHRAAARPLPRAGNGAATPATAPRARNVEAILSLGDTRYVMFRGRPYACPPVPWKLGVRVADVYARTFGAATDVATGHREAQVTYRTGLAQLARLLWRGMRPCGPWRRAFRRAGLLRNPFVAASDKELAELADFFLQGRMMSSVRPTSAPRAEA